MKKPDKRPSSNPSPSSHAGQHRCQAPAQCPICRASRAAAEKSAPATRADIDRLTAQITDLIRKNPGKAATILSSWLNQPSASTSNSKKKAA